MKRVIIESPFRGASRREQAENIAYARRCVRDSLERGEAPIASHLLYTQDTILRDDVPEERAWGIQAGLTWLRVADATVVYIDRGTSYGMQMGMEAARAAGVPVEIRKLGEKKP